MSVIRPYLVILLLAVLMFHTIIPASASNPPVRPGGGVITQTEPDKDGGAGHPTGGQGWGEGTPSGGFYVISDENTPDTLIPLGPGVRLIVIFRGGTADGKPCLVFGRGQSLPPIIHCTAE